MKIKLKNTRLVDEYKRPVLFFHTSPVDSIENFLPLSHFGTKNAAEMRAQHFMYQALGIPEPAQLQKDFPSRLKKRLTKSEQVPQLFTYPVYLYSKSALKIPDLGQHDIIQYKTWFRDKYAPKSLFLTGKERLEGDGVGETKTKYKKALTEFIFEAPFKQKQEELEKELSADSLFENHVETAKKVAFQRMIHFLEGEGYDAFSYNNDYEDKNKTSFIIFRPEQVFHQDSAETEHLLPTKDLDLLEKIEKDFFEKYQTLSPRQRIKNHQMTLKKFQKTL